MQNAVAAHPGRARAAAASPRRRKARAKTRRLGTLEAVLILLVGAVLVLTLVWQVSADGTASVEQTAVIVVAPSDTLWDIAQAHPVEGSNTAETVRTILEINQMDDSALVAGQSLLVPAPTPSEASVALR